MLSSEIVIEKHLFKVSVEVALEAGRECIESFTGKVVKSFLIERDVGLKKFFSKSSGGAPKLIHITPLYVESYERNGRKVRCVHSLCGKDKLSRGEIRRYLFYVGLVESSTVDSPSYDSVYRAILNLSGRHRFENSSLVVELESLESVDVFKRADGVIRGLIEKGKMRVVFASPTLLRDPFRSSKYKSLVPTPINIFSTPTYINLYLTGRLRQKLFARTLVTLHRLLGEPHSIYKTAKITQIKYDRSKKPIRVLIGYVNLYLNGDYYTRYRSNGIDVEAVLRDVFSTALALGTGTSRAAGFGHVELVVPIGDEERRQSGSLAKTASPPRPLPPGSGGRRTHTT